MSFRESHAVRARKRFQRTGIVTGVVALVFTALLAPGWGLAARHLFGPDGMTPRRSPLIEAAALVGELGGTYNYSAVMRVAADRNSAARLLAIEALGESRASRALGLLESFVRDETEPADVRRASLEALYLIGGGQSLALAREHVHDPALAPAAQDIVDGGGAIRGKPSRLDSLLRMVR